MAGVFEILHGPIDKRSLPMLTLTRNGLPPKSDDMMKPATSLPNVRHGKSKPGNAAPAPTKDHSEHI